MLISEKRKNPIVSIMTASSNPDRQIRVSENIIELTGLENSLFEQSKADFFSLICINDLEQFQKEYYMAIDSGHLTRLSDCRIINMNNETKYLQIWVSPGKDTIELQILDISEYKQKIQSNSKIINRYENLLKTLNEAIWDWNVKTDSVYYSRQWSEMLGYAPNEIEGTLRDWKEAMHRDDRKMVEQEIQKHFKGETPLYECTYRLRAKDGHYIWVTDRGVKQLDKFGEISRMIGSHRDITAEKQTREELQQMIITDELTGLYNRRHYNEVIEDEIHRAERYGNDLSILMIDIDLFKKINDTYGHHAGDTALQRLAEIIQKIIRNTDSAYRIGGEEFVILAPETGEESALMAAERLRAAVCGQIIETDYGSFSFTISIGTATFHSGESRTKLNERADRALYKSKDSGRNCVTVG